MQKQTPQSNPVETYIASFPEPVQKLMHHIAATIRAAAPGATEETSYQMPSFHLNGPVAYFAVYKHHIGFYPTPSAITHFKKEIAQYKSSKGAVQFPLDKPIPYDLIDKMVRFKVSENSHKESDSF